MKMVIRNINPSIESHTEVVPDVRHVQDAVRRLGDVSFVPRLLRRVQTQLVVHSLEAAAWGGR